MTTKAKAAEADRAAIAFHIALTRIGLGTIEEAMALWTDVNPAKIAPTSGRWLDRAVILVMSRRQWSRDLAFAYYRLVRALRTGATIKDPYHPNEPHPTLTGLRREFATAVDEVARVSGPATGVPDSTPPVAVPDENDRLLVEELKQLREEEVRLEKAAEEEARIALEALGPANLESRLKDLDPEMSAREMDAAREAAHLEAGVRQAAAAERIVMDGGRGALWSYADQDERAIGYVRVSRTGTPCGFCAMLISRGVIFYKSKATAGFRSDGDLYHDKCHCYAEPVFSTQQYAQSDLFALNRQYTAEWKTEIKDNGLTGKDALNAWRRYINRQQGRTFNTKD